MAEQQGITFADAAPSGSSVGEIPSISVPTIVLVRVVTVLWQERTEPTHLRLTVGIVVVWLYTIS